MIKINNNQIVKANGDSLLVLASGNITISSSRGDRIVKKQSILLSDIDFEITTASPYLDGYVIEIPEGDIRVQEVLSSLKEKMGFYKTYKIADWSSKKELIGSMSRSKNKKSLFSSYLHVLLAALLEDISEDVKEQSVYEQFCGLIDDNLENNYCAGEYADIMSIPIRTLIYEVKKATDETPCQVITNRVIKGAQNKLLYTSDSSKMIAYQLGFDDPYYFIKYFKKNVGVTPTQFRKSKLAIDRV